MNLVGEIRRRARHIVGPVLGITLFAYFVYHVVQGDRGLIAWWRLGQQVETAEVAYHRISAERAAFAHRVKLLQPGSLDPDLLEERARATLGFAHPDDLVILKAAPVDVSPPRGSSQPRTAGEPGSERFQLRYSFGVSFAR